MAKKRPVAPEVAEEAAAEKQYQRDLRAAVVPMGGNKHGVLPPSVRQGARQRKAKE